MKAVTRPRWSIGYMLVAIVGAIAIGGFFFSPYSPLTTVGAVGEGPSVDHLLGTDMLGRDVLSRVLRGGLSVLWMGALATLLTYTLGIVVGLIAGYRGSWIDVILMRASDVVLAFPTLLGMLLALTAGGRSIAVMIIGIAILRAPSVARVVRTATASVVATGYVEAAITRGEHILSLVWREILPNINGVLIARLGLHFTVSVSIVASLNFLGLGLQPPSPDWALMIAENRVLYSLNPLAVLVPAGLLGVLTVGITLIGDVVSAPRSRLVRSSKLGGAS